MSDPNPYSSPAAQTTSIDPALLHAVAIKLATARLKPPTVLGMLCQWSSGPLLLLVGGGGAGFLALLAQSSGSTANSMTFSGGSLAIAAFSFGALCRDLGIAIRSVRFWLPQSHFIDWNKVNEFTQ